MRTIKSILLNPKTCAHAADARPSQGRAKHGPKQIDYVLVESVKEGGTRIGGGGQGWQATWQTLSDQLRSHPQASTTQAIK